MNVDRAVLHDVKPARRIALVEKVFVLGQGLEHGDGGDVFQIGRRQTREQLATPQGVDEASVFEFGKVVGMDRQSKPVSRQK